MIRNVLQLEFRVPTNKNKLSGTENPHTHRDFPHTAGEGHRREEKEESGTGESQESRRGHRGKAGQGEDRKGQASALRHQLYCASTFLHFSHIPNL